MVVSDSSTIYIPGRLEFSGNSSSTSVYLNGKIILKGNLMNFSTSPVFEGIETIPNGELIMNGSAVQTISGNVPFHFENLTLTNNRKILNLNGCKIKGILTLDAELELNSSKLVIDNSLPSAIKYKSKFIKSETFPDESLSIIEWNVGSSNGVYTIPFGSGEKIFADLKLQINIHPSPGASAGSIKFATYPTLSFNKPFPEGVNSLSVGSAYVADRFWIIEPDYLVKPDVDIEFTYCEDDVDPSANPFIKKDSLKAFRFNTDQYIWNDWIPSSTSIASENKVATGTIDGKNFYTTWVLQNQENKLTYYVPNAFTPNGDGLNDTFGPILEIPPKSYKFYILDRREYDIFYSDDPSKQWDGKDDRNIIKAPGMYVWILMAVDEYGNEYSANGHVMLLK